MGTGRGKHPSRPCPYPYNTHTDPLPPPATTFQNAPRLCFAPFCNCYCCFRTRRTDGTNNRISNSTQSIVEIVASTTSRLCVIAPSTRNNTAFVRRHTQICYAIPHHTGHPLASGTVNWHCIELSATGNGDWRICALTSPICPSIYSRLDVDPVRKKRSKQLQLAPQSPAQFLITPPLFDPQGKERGNLRQQS